MKSNYKMNPYFKKLLIKSRVNGGLEVLLNLAGGGWRI